MNIHFTDKTLLDGLVKSTIVNIKVGSHVYGLENEQSDDDWLVIYLESFSERDSFMWEHHQLQYKEDGVDHNFTSLQVFIRNILTGDNTINFEALHSDTMRDSNLSWLWDMRDDFVNHNIIKSYLGLAKRDLKFWLKDTNKGKKHSAKTYKRLSHFIRGVIFAKQLIEGTFSLDLTKSNTTTLFDGNDYQLVKAVKEGNVTGDIERLYNHYEIIMIYIITMKYTIICLLIKWLN